MTAMLKGFIVTLEDDMRVDDAENTINAIRLIRGVLSVEPVESKLFGDHFERQRVRSELIGKLMKVLE